MVDSGLSSRLTSLLVSFMTDEEGPGGDWPNGAAAKVLISDGIPTRDALVWRPQPLTVADAPAFWPLSLIHI